MSDINFLPASFVRERAAQRRRIRHLAILAVTVVAMVGWWLSSQSTIAAQRSYAETLQQQIAAAKGQVSETHRLQSEQQVLAHQLRVQQELAQPIAHTQILAILGQLMHESMAIVELNVTAQRPPMRPLVASNATDARRSGNNANRRRTAEAVSHPDLLQIELAGVAGNDLQIANFVGDLTEHPAFENVKMHFSRSVTLGPISAREFRIEMQVPLDCRYEPVRVERGVADAH